jgi:hypothetical protein
MREVGAGGVAQVVEGLPSKHKALRSNPSTTKKKERDRGKTGPTCHGMAVYLFQMNSMG